MARLLTIAKDTHTSERKLTQNWNCSSWKVPVIKLCNTNVVSLMLDSRCCVICAVFSSHECLM